jgi:hypothetical protein
MLEHLEHRNDVRMRKPRDSLCLASEAIAVAIRSVVWKRRLQRDKAVEVDVAGLIHDTHPAPAEFGFDGVMADDAWQVERTRHSGAKPEILRFWLPHDRKPRFAIGGYYHDVSRPDPSTPRRSGCS